MRLKDKVALITGAASGMGRAQINRFSDEGAKVVAIDIDKDGLDELARDAKDTDMDILTLEIDITDSKALETGVKKALEKFEKIDIVSNTAGMLDDYAPVLDTDEELWDNILNINLKGTYLVTKAVLPTMIEQGKGTIINFASIAGFVAGGGGAAYTSSKHGVIGFTKQLAHDYGKKGIRTNAIAPGFIETSMTEDVDPSVTEDIPATRPGKADEVAELALFLVSDDSNYIHGETIKIDGGWTVN